MCLLIWGVIHETFDALGNIRVHWEGEEVVVKGCGGRAGNNTSYGVYVFNNCHLSLGILQQQLLKLTHGRVWHAPVGFSDS